MTGRPLSMLVVDDEPDVLEVLALFAADALPGVRIRTAPSGHAAFAALEEEPFDVVLCDYRMPDYDGIEVLQRAAELLPGAHLALMTAYADSSLPEKAHAALPLRAFFEKAADPARIRSQLTALMPAARA